MSIERELLATTDAQVWARRFMETQRAASAEGRTIVDEGTMIGWFANAIEVGRDAGRNPDPNPLVDAVARCILRHQIGTTEPVTPAPWMTAAAQEIVDAFGPCSMHTVRHIAALIELGVTA